VPNESLAGGYALGPGQALPGGRPHVRASRRPTAAAAGDRTPPVLTGDLFRDDHVPAWCAATKSSGQPNRHSIPALSALVIAATSSCSAARGQHRRPPPSTSRSTAVFAGSAARSTPTVRTHQTVAGHHASGTPGSAPPLTCVHTAAEGRDQRQPRQDDTDPRGPPRRNECAVCRLLRVVILERRLLGRSGRCGVDNLLGVRMRNDAWVRNGRNEAGRVV